MTAPALPRDDQHTEQVFDLALEQMLDGEVVCLDDSRPAVARVIHGTCSVPVCADHERRMGKWLAYLTVTGARIRCSQCGGSGIEPKTVKVRPI